jgi:succinate dehydrogenase/fumarate reductase cytochrome b subunit
MTSGDWILYYVPFFYVSFIAWELLQLWRRRNGNTSAYTVSQMITRNAKAGKKVYKWIAILYPLFHIVVGVWLVFHFGGPCLAVGWFCEVDI